MPQASNAKRSRSKPASTGRLNIRTSARQQTLVREGATLRGMTVSEFVLQAACSLAEQVIANQTEFSMPAAKWKQFIAALDRPAQAKPELQRLFAMPSILER